MSITVHILYCPSVQPVEIVFVVHYKIKNNQQIVSICSPVEGDPFSKQLTIEIPLIAPLNPTLKSPLSNTALNTPVCEFSPVSPVAPVPQALFCQ